MKADTFQISARLGTYRIYLLIVEELLTETEIVIKFQTFNFLTI
jgi:hypothetical protein